MFSAVQGSILLQLELFNYIYVFKPAFNQIKKIIEIVK